MTARTVWIGWDPNEMMAWTIAAHSLHVNTMKAIAIRRLALLELRANGLYSRPTVRQETGALWDVISEAPMTTEHAISRFLIPHLMNYQGWGLFVDGDVLFRSDVVKLFDLADPRYAVQVVQHPPLENAQAKKDGLPQTVYPRKNWSSVMLINCGHPANRLLSPEVVNRLPGRDLHAFAWLSDNRIGALPASWNYLVGVSADPGRHVDLAHFTLGVPSIAGHETDPFASEWFDMARRAGYRLDREQVAV